MVVVIIPKCSSPICTMMFYNWNLEKVDQTWESFNDHFKSKRFFFFTIELFLSYLNIKLKLRKERNKFEIKKAADSDPVNLCRSERIQLPQQSHLHIFYPLTLSNPSQLPSLIIFYIFTCNFFTCNFLKCNFFKIHFTFR